MGRTLRTLLTVAGAGFLACSPVVGAPIDDDAGADPPSGIDGSTTADTGTGRPDTSTGQPDAAIAPDATSVPDTGSPPTDAGAPTDATTTDATTDATTPTDAGADAAPPPTATTVKTGVAHFDVNATHVVYRVGGTIFQCALPDCSATRTVYSPGYYPFTVSDTRIFFFTLRTINQNMLSSASVTGPLAITPEDNFTWQGGVIPQSIWVGATRIEANYTLKPFLTGFDQPRTTAKLVTSTRAPAALGTRHLNFGSEASLRDSKAPTVTGATLPTLPTAASLIATSPRGPTVTYPTTVVLRDGRVEACPTAANCAAWLDLGAIGAVLNLDEEHLYVGNAAGLGRCALAEIATVGTCTLAPLVTGEAVSNPMYVSPTHVYYLSAGDIRRVAK